MKKVKTMLDWREEYLSPCPFCGRKQGNHFGDCPAVKPLPQAIYQIEGEELEIEVIPQMGWVCPNCDRGLAPWVAFCPCYKEKEDES